MDSGSLSSTLRVIASEVEQTLSRVRGQQVAAFEDALLTARAAFSTGEGRSGLVARAFAMRLLHLGLRSYVVGDAGTPAAGGGDLLVAVSGSGATGVTLARAAAAGRAGLRVVAVTATPDSALARAAELQVVVPARRSTQFGGSLFEQSALLLLDALVLRLQQRLVVSPAEMQARHATLE